MKKVLGVLVVLVGALAMNCMGAKAAENPIKAIDYCGIVTATPGQNVRLKIGNNTCKVTVTLNDSTYTVEKGDGNVTFNNGENKHEIVVKDASGKTTTYTMNVSFNAETSAGTNNPSTGDNTLAYGSLGLISLAVIALGCNRVKKYSK